MIKGFQTFLIVAICSIGASSIYGQFILNNPSFEDEPSDANVPMGWFACEEGTTPDVLPGPWGVVEDSYEGETYVGLITRRDRSFESIGQRFSEKLTKDMCYSFSFALGKSRTYNGYNKDIYLRIWGGTRKCKKTQLLYESQAVDFDDWKEIKVKFTAEKKLEYILFEAYWPEDKPARNGHILIDNISEIDECSKV